MENKQPVGINMNMCDDKEIVIPSVKHRCTRGTNKIK